MLKRRVAMILVLCMTAMLLAQPAFAGTDDLSEADMARMFPQEYPVAAEADPVQSDGIVQPGLQTIDGVMCFILEDGTKAIGPVQVEGKLYYFDETGAAVMTEGWFTGIDKKKRYGLGDGTVATGILKIKKDHYFFNEETGAAQGKGFFKYKGDSYFCKGKGKLAVGWMAKGKRAYYFYESGKHVAQQAKSDTIGFLKIPKSGHLGEAYALGIKTLNKKGWTLRAAYTFSYKLKYYGRSYRTRTSEQYSLRGFKKGKGNCYVMAATFYIMAKLLGYDVHQVYGKVDLPHSWTEIKQDGKTYVYDPNFRNETGRNGFKIWYGKPGTWRYHKQGSLN